MRAVSIGVSAAVVALTIFALAAWPRYRDHISPFPQDSSATGEMTSDETASPSRLAGHALDKILTDAVPIFGKYEYSQIDTSKWMAAYPDDTLLAHMNIPGAHDAATWNYSDATQKQLKKVTDLVNSTIEFPSEAFRCQDTSLIKMLNSGIRVFDLRYAFDPTRTSITFWHSVALLSETGNLENVLFGFYKWLDDHPSEALMLSFQYEPSEHMGNGDSQEIQTLLYETLTNSVAKKYIRQSRVELGCLGDARGKITLLRRFDLDKAPPTYEDSIPGLHFSPNDWIINGQNTTIVYNPSPVAGGESGKAMIQDYYQPKTAKNSSTAQNVDEKLKAVLLHFQLAAEKKHKDDLFWSFMSATNIHHTPPISPRMMALGEGASDHLSERAAIGELKGTEGVNQRLISVFKEMKGRRLGIVMFDFFERPKELLPLFLSLLSPSSTQKASDGEGI